MLIYFTYGSCFRIPLLWESSIYYNLFILFLAQYFLKGCVIDDVAYGDTTFVVGIEYEDVPVSSFELKQNYPNQFNPNTTIKYNIPTEGNIRFIVYNSLGEVVGELVNEWQPAGKYSVVFSKNNLSCGVYFYSLKYCVQVIKNELRK